MYRPEFDIKLEIGECREEAFAKVFKDKEVVYLEHKSDVMSRKTGNVFIEVFQGTSRKPSGISISKADYWAIETFPERWIVIKLEELKRITKRAIKMFGFTPGGDNKNIGALVPLKWLVQQ